MPTQQEIIKNQIELAKLSDDDLKAFNKAYLLKKLQGVGVDKVEQDGEIIPVSKARKITIIDTLKQASLPQKTLDILIPESGGITKEILTELKQKFEIENNVPIASIAVDIFEEYVRAVNLIVEGLNEFEIGSRLQSTAKLLVAKLDTYKATKNLQSSKTIANYRGMIFDYMRNDFFIHVSDIEHRSKLQKHFETFKTLAIKLHEDLKKEIVDDDKKNLLARRDKDVDDFLYADISNLLTWANDTLTNLNSETSKMKWRDVSIALAIVTGRRQVEIHGNGSFELTDSPYEVLFTGQAKTKEGGLAREYFEQNPSYKIPTLVKSELVVKGQKFLADKGRTNLEAKKVNDNLNGEIGDLFDVLIPKYTTIYKGQDKVKIENPEFISLKKKQQLEKQNNLQDNQIVGTYHTLRQWYALACYLGSKTQREFDLYIADILGHDRTTGQSVALGSTAMRYKADYKLMETSLTRI